MNTRCAEKTCARRCQLCGCDFRMLCKRCREERACAVGVVVVLR